MTQRSLHALLVTATFILFFACSGSHKNPEQNTNNDKFSEEEKKNHPIRTFKDITASDTLHVAIQNTPTSYFIYQGTVLGFEYELLSDICKDLDLVIKPVIVENIDDAFYLLINGKVDIAAMNLTITNTRKERVDFTEPVYTTSQVLVQRKPDNWRKIAAYKTEQQLIRDLNLLNDSTIHIRMASSYLMRLNNLEEELGIDINIEQAEQGVTTEMLIDKLAEKEINYVVADENIAGVFAHFDKNIDFSTPVSLEQNVAWAVNKKSVLLKDTISHYIHQLKTKPILNILKKRYFESNNSAVANKINEIIITDKRTISPYDSLIQFYAKEIDWDWRLLSALIYQESEFNSDLISWRGAKGLMQLMPINSDECSGNIFNPNTNLKCGTNYLSWLKDYWIKHSVPQKELPNFVLASYNCGQGHLQDAIRLAKKYNYNPTVWTDNVEKCLLMKSDPKYYNDPVVKFGYCRGREPVNYVSEIKVRYEEYESLF